MSRRTLSYYALFSLILTMILGCIFGPSTAYAAEPNGQEEVEAAFDLEQYLPQSKTIFLANGEEAEIGIRPVPTIRPMWDSYYSNASGDWEIYYNSPIIYRHFYITIDNHKITRAHSPSYTTFLCSVTGEQFSWSSTVATYRLNIEVTGGMGSTVAALQALMEGTTLHTYAN
jgi:hypothetical protein